MEFPMEWNVICRVCLQEGEMFSIFEKDENGISTSDKLMHCSNIKIEMGVDLPENICGKCLENLQIAYTFRNCCESSDAVLQSFVNGDMMSDLVIRSNGQIYKYKPPRDLKVMRIPKEEKNFDLLAEEAIEEEKVLGLELEEPEPEPETQIEANDETFDESGVFGHFAVTEQDQEQEQEEERIDDPPFPSQTDDHLSQTDDQFDMYDQDETTSNNNSDINLTSMSSYMVIEDGKNVFTVSVQDDNSSTSLIEYSEHKKNNSNTTIEPKSENLTRRTKSRMKGEKPMHICDICGNSYKQRHSLETHMRRHRNEKPFACEICGRGFVLNVELKCHMRTHTGHKPYPCRHCGRKFSDFGSRIKHERTHTGERPYVCETCGKAFAYSYGLSSHILTHTGEKRFECDKCGKRFAKKHHLKNHLNTHTKQKTRLETKCLSPTYFASIEDDYSSIVTVFTGEHIENLDDYVIDVVGIKEEIGVNDESESTQAIQELPS